MSHLSDYNPLAGIKIAGLTIENPSGVIVVVGPNSSGKTLFLKDIERYLLTGDAGGVVCNSIDPKPPTDAGELFHELHARHLIRKDQQQQFQVNLPHLSDNNFARRPFTLQAIQESGKQFTKGWSASNPKFFGAIGLSLVAYLSMEARRAVCAPAPGFNYQQEAPKHPLQGLQLDSEAMNVIGEETGRVFGDAVWLDISEQSTFRLRMSDAPAQPVSGETANPLRASKYYSIQQAGDGIQSYVGVCICVLLGLRPVVLIDEPELCLHPPQAYQLGRFIGERSTHSQVTIVATHSGYLLRGVLDAGKSVRVVRLTHSKGTFVARSLPNETLREVVRNPRSRAEATLDGLFSKSVILVESDGDREVYGAACENLATYPSREIHFVATHGTGGFAELCRFYTSLGVPVSLIADLDLIADTDKMVAILEALNPGVDLAELIVDLRGLGQKLKALPPAITVEQVKEELNKLASAAYTWATDDDNKLRSRLNDLEQRIKRIRRLKEGGVEAYEPHPDIHDMFRRLVPRCHRLGIFLVSVGELEDWVPGLMSDCGKNRPKMERALVMADRIRTATDKTDDIWAFTQAVVQYLESLATPKRAVS
jgi:hypothetical protein